MSFGRITFFFLFGEKIYHLTDAIYRSIDWLIACLLHGPIDWLIDWSFDYKIDCSIDCLIDWSFDWLIDRSIDWLVVWLFDFQKNNEEEDFCAVKLDFSERSAATDAAAPTGKYDGAAGHIVIQHRQNLPVTAGHGWPAFRQLPSRRSGRGVWAASAVAAGKAARHVGFFWWDGWATEPGTRLWRVHPQLGGGF